jgi:hypothetical protein
VPEKIFNVKEREEGRRSGMTIKYIHKRDGKAITEKGREEIKTRNGMGKEEKYFDRLL